MGNYNQNMVFCLQSRVNFGAACRALLGASSASNSSLSSASCMKDNDIRNKVMCGTFRLLLGAALDASPGPSWQVRQALRRAQMACLAHCATLTSRPPLDNRGQHQPKIQIVWLLLVHRVSRGTAAHGPKKSNAAHRADVQLRCSIRISRAPQPKSTGSCSAMQPLSREVRECAPRLLRPARRLRCCLCAAAWPRGRPLPRPPPQSVPRHRSQIPRDPSAAVVPAVNESLRESQSVSGVGNCWLKHIHVVTSDHEQQ